MAFVLDWWYMRGRSCSGPQSRSCPQDTCGWCICLEEMRTWVPYFFKMLCKHLAVQAEGHLTAGLYWQWCVLVPDQTEIFGSFPEEEETDLAECMLAGWPFCLCFPDGSLCPGVTGRAPAFGQEGWEFLCCASHCSCVWGSPAAWKSLGLVVPWKAGLGQQEAE